MGPQNKVCLDEELAEALPAQARDTVAGESGLELPADQVCAQRRAENPLNNGIPTPNFVP
jgi:hypothetical protein